MISQREASHLVFCPRRVRRVEISRTRAPWRRPRRPMEERRSLKVSSQAMVRLRELDGDALASDVDGFDANGARLADAIERVGINLGVGVGVGAFAHRGDV
jgi:hypothetical protein